MKMKRVLGIGLALLLAVAALATAGGTKQSGGTGGGVTVIRVWANDAHNKILYDQLVEKFNAGIGAEQGIKVEYTVYGADYDQVMNVALSSGKEPEMFKGVSNLGNFQREGKLLPWKEIPGIDDILKAQEPFHLVDSSIFQGEIYTVCVAGWSTGFHYNKSLLQRAGYSAPPKTWAEFEDAAIKISKLEPGKIYGYAIPLAFAPGFREWMLEMAAAPSVGHMYYNHTQVKYQFADFTPYLEMISRLREAKAIFPGMENLTDDQMRAHFADGNIGFILGGGWNVGVLYDQFPFGGGTSGSPANALGWDYAPLPVQNPNQTFATPVFSGGDKYVSAQVRNDKDKLAKIGHVIRLFAGDEIQAASFSAGYGMPLRGDIVAKAAPAARPQWSDYGQSSPITLVVPPMPHDFLAPEGADMTAVFSQIITGQVAIANIRTTLTDLDRRYNAALEQAFQRGVIKREDYTNPNLETLFKRK
ncbi:hypothetical protein FACS189476_01070 [Spirochaetia bacterium]|nr:hypothetical protein FACS189476_01070 [Spirochaetia bacterium]